MAGKSEEIWVFIQKLLSTDFQNSVVEILNTKKEIGAQVKLKILSYAQCKVFSENSLGVFNFFNLLLFNSGPLLMGQPYKPDVPDFDPKINKSLVMRLDP